jgi:hypothetical protein
LDLIASKGVCFEMPLRRTFLMGLGASSLLAGTTSGISLGCQTNAWTIDPARFDSLLSVLKKIREIGFAGFETVSATFGRKRSISTIFSPAR